jgi:ABC transport permease subunit
MARELAPVITSVVVAGRVGSAFAAELASMQVSEQADVLRVLGIDPIDYLITPRVVACTLANCFLTAFAFACSSGAGSLLAQARHGIPSSMLLDSAAKALVTHDVFGMLCKAFVFGFLLSVISCSWGYTTRGGAKGVGESATAAVVISLVAIFLCDFALTLTLFAGPGSASLL